MRRSLALLAAVCAGVLPVSVAPAADACEPGPNPATPVITLDSGATGRIAMPHNAQPDTLVVYAHGYRNDSASWTCHLLEAAERGAVAVAMDYRGTGYAGGPDYGGAAPEDRRGWFVREGAADSIEAAQAILSALPSIDEVGLLGVSMGGNTSGLAAAAGATRADGSPLFDHWVSVEGAVNVAETYALAALVEQSGGDLGAYAGGAREDIEVEVGHRPGDDSAAFAEGLADLAVLSHVDEIAAAGLDTVTVVHGLDDGLVPYDQSRSLVTALRAHRVPTAMHTVLRRNDWANPDTAADEGGTVATGHALGPVFGAAGATYPAPFAGHGWEGSSTHLVIRTGIEALFDAIDGTAGAGDAEWLVDADLGSIRVL